MISFDNPNGVGLVGVVAWASVNGSGDGEVRMVAQNDSTGGWRVLSVGSWAVAPVGQNTPYGWLHDPQGRGTGGSASCSGSGRPHCEPTDVDPRPVVPDPPAPTQRPPVPPLP